MILLQLESIEYKCFIQHFFNFQIFFFPFFQNMENKREFYLYMKLTRFSTREKCFGRKSKCENSWQL